MDAPVVRESLGRRRYDAARLCPCRVDVRQEPLPGDRGLLSDKLAEGEVDEGVVDCSTGGRTLDLGRLRLGGERGGRLGRGRSGGLGGGGGGDGGGAAREEAECARCDAHRRLSLLRVGGRKKKVHVVDDHTEVEIKLIEKEEEKDRGRALQSRQYTCDDLVSMKVCSR